MQEKRKPAWIRTVEPDEAEGFVKQEYDDVSRKLGMVPDIVSVHSLSPQSMKGFSEFSKLLFMPSALRRAQKEMIGVVVSVLNKCHY